jgi:hypothetical protein
MRYAFFPSWCAPLPTWCSVATPVLRCQSRECKSNILIGTNWASIACVGSKPMKNSLCLCENEVASGPTWWSRFECQFHSRLGNGAPAWQRSIGVATEDQLGNGAHHSRLHAFSPLLHTLRSCGLYATGHSSPTRCFQFSALAWRSAGLH